MHDVVDAHHEECRNGHAALTLQRDQLRRWVGIPSLIGPRARAAAAPLADSCWAGSVYFQISRPRQPPPPEPEGCLQGRRCASSTTWGPAGRPTSLLGGGGKGGSKGGKDKKGGAGAGGKGDAAKAAAAAAQASAVKP